MLKAGASNYRADFRQAGLHGPYKSYMQYIDIYINIYLYI